MAVALLPLPWTRRLMMRIAFCISGVLLMTLAYSSYPGQPLDGLLLFGTGGILLLTGVVYFSDWFENIDYGLRIVQLVLGSAVAGGIAGYAIFGLAGIFSGTVLAGFAAELIGAFGALYLDSRDRRKAREHEMEIQVRQKTVEAVGRFRLSLRIGQNRRTVF